MINSQEPLSRAPVQATQSRDPSLSREGVERQSDTLKDGLCLRREQVKMAAGKASRVTYDLPPDLRKSRRMLSEEVHIPASQLTALAPIRFLKEFKSGALDLSSYRKPWRSPRYDW